ncbi:MAG: Asp-tRNA(Asn)/Glu-tRNA(Gln) amidotransferase subunit GatB [Thermoguttaceae bacterium]
MPYQLVVGLEVHVQLLTQSKLFCGCSTTFGAEPNTQTCPVCTGSPGALPVMNRQAYHLAVKAALGLNCQIAARTRWDRKSYYYPDLPKGYQISQYDQPLSYDGYLDILDPDNEGHVRRIGIIRAHLEEDAGKSMHDEVAGKADSRIDLNRTGTPLLEIVSKPDLRSPAEARNYLNELKLLLNYLQISDCNMQEGSLRVDANVNLHIDTPEGKVATPIVEVKNMNSFRAVERALACEAQRQWEAWQETGQKLGDVPKQTRGWDDVAQVTRGQRSKEESSDYRYFPDPDLVPVTITPEAVDQIRRSLGELPARLRDRLVRQYGITPYDSDVLVNQGRQLVDYFTAVADGCGDGKTAANWIQQSVLRTLNEQQISIDRYPVSADALAGLIAIVLAGRMETSRGREVLARILETGQSVDQAIQALGIAEVDQSELQQLCAQLLAENPKVVQDVKQGKLKAAASLIGQAKRKNPNVNAARVQEICLQLIEQM